MNQIEKAVIKTLCYADVFDFPLKIDEIYSFLITDKYVGKSKVHQSVNNLIYEEDIGEKDSLFFLKKRSRLVSMRQKRQKFSEKKLEIAKRVVEELKQFPNLTGIFLTGAVAMENASEEDDIDLMIVTLGGKLWSSRLRVLKRLNEMDMRRKPDAKKVKDLICTNIFVDETALEIPPVRRSLYTAHEVIQVKCLLSRNQVEERFLKVNSWVGKYLANFKIQPGEISSNPVIINTEMMEKLSYFLQASYMKRRQTNEKVSFRAAFFSSRK